MDVPPHSVVLTRPPSVITHANTQVNANNGFTSNYNMESQPATNHPGHTYQPHPNAPTEPAGHSEYAGFGPNIQSYEQPVFDMSPHNYASVPNDPMFPATPYPGPQLPAPNAHPGRVHAGHPYAAFNQSAPPPNVPPHPNYVNDSGSLSEKQSTHTSNSDDKHHPNSFLNRLIDSMRNVPLVEVLPVVAFFGAALVHHYRNRKSGTMVPYEERKWTKYVRNAVFAHNLYGFAQDNGFIKAQGKREVQAERGIQVEREVQAERGIQVERGIQAERGMQANLATNPSNANTRMPNLVHTLVSSLFQSSLDRRHNLADTFDHSWAVPIHIAESYYNRIYHNSTNLQTANAVVLGGASAIKAIRSQPLEAHPLPANYNTENREYVLLDFALSEANSLLSCKAAAGGLNDDDTLERVGKIALATIIKIKMNEDARLQFAVT